MKIIKEDQNLMVIKDRNIFAFLIGAVFMLVGLLVILKPNLFSDQPPFWLGLVMALVGGFVILFAKAITVILDKTSSKILVAEKALLSRNTKEYGFDQIVKIELQKNYNTSRKGGGGFYKLAFVLNDGKQITLSVASGVVMGMEIIPGKEKGARIAKFLNVPFEERRPPTVSEAISAIQTGIQNAAQKEIERRK